MKKYLILPGNDDQNRGDQALVWEAKRIAEESGCIGQFYMFSNPTMSSQSVEEGIVPVNGILLHPSRFFKDHNNIKYSKRMLVKWGFVAMFDFLYSRLLLVPGLRRLIVFLSSKRIKEAFSIMEQCDGVFVKGGGFVHANGEKTAYYRIYYMLFHILLAKKLKKRIVMLPNSFGPFDGVGVKKLVKRVVSKIDLLYSRETLSQNMLRGRLRIESYLRPDLGFYLSSEHVDISKYLDRNKKNVALTARPYRFPGASNPDELYEKYLTDYTLFVKWLIDNGFNPVFVEHVYNINAHERDLICINEICKRLSNVGYSVSIISDWNFNCRHLKGVYKQFDYLVGTRFHSVIFGLSEGIPSLAITYGGNKGDGIMKDLGLTNFSVPISSFSFEALRTAFAKLANNEQRGIDFSFINNQRKLMVNEIKELFNENTIVNKNSAEE